MSWPRRAAWAVAFTTLLVVVSSVTATVLAGHTAEQVPAGFGAFIAAVTVGLGLVVAWREPGNWVAPLLCWMALVAAVGSFSDTYLPEQQRRPGLLPALPPQVDTVLVATWVWLYAAIAMVMLFFPDGRLPGYRWRKVAGGLVAVGVSVQAVMAVSPGPYDAPYGKVRHPFGQLPGTVVVALKAIAFPLLGALLLAALASLWARFRTGDQMRRAQLKWLALAGLILPVTVVASWASLQVRGDHAWAGYGIDLLLVAIPAATTIAILRYDLYNVDRALSAAVTYGAVTAGLLVVFAVTSFGSGLLFGQDSVVTAAGTTAVTALILAPLRTRLQRHVDARLYPARRAVLQAIEDLHTRTTAGRAQPEQLEQVLRGALRDPALRVGFLLPGTDTYVNAAGEEFEMPASAAPVVFQGRQAGAIVSAGPVFAQLRRPVTAAAALLVEVVRLRLEVSMALREVESSRARLVRAGYQERRRLERDLHDGAQQRLVSLGMALRLAQRHLGDGTTDLDGLLDQSVAELGTAVAELRQIAQGLRPSSLDNGLSPALTVLSESIPLPIDLDIHVSPVVPDDIAVTVYYIVSEAMTNVVKHADARRLRLHVRQDNGRLNVCVEDDGRGGAAPRPSSGLAGMLDRVAALGGSLLVHSPPGQGTRVEATLPCAS